MGCSNSTETSSDAPHRLPVAAPAFHPIPDRYETIGVVLLTSTYRAHIQYKWGTLTISLVALLAMMNNSGGPGGSAQSGARVLKLDRRGASDAERESATMLKASN